eukprot:PhM_4_TR2045/c4_g1_i1/m.95482
MHDAPSSVMASDPRASVPCRYYWGPERSCARGSGCPYMHEDNAAPPSVPPPPPPASLPTTSSEGSSESVDVGRGEEDVSQVPCRFYWGRSQHCSAGAACPYMHEPRRAGYVFSASNDNANSFENIDRASITSEDILDRLPSYDFVSAATTTADGSEEGRMCVLCLEVFQVGDHMLMLPCMHGFHKDCVMPWLTRDHSCPTCRLPLKPQKA